MKKSYSDIEQIIETENNENDRQTMINYIKNNIDYNADSYNKMLEEMSNKELNDIISKNDAEIHEMMFPNECEDAYDKC